MDPASLDPRLRDAGEDSIVVGESAQQSAPSVQPVQRAAAATAAKAEVAPSPPQHPGQHQQQQQQQQQQQHHLDHHHSLGQPQPQQQQQQSLPPLQQLQQHHPHLPHTPAQPQPQIPPQHPPPSQPTTAVSPTASTSISYAPQTPITNPLAANSGTPIDPNGTPGDPNDPKRPRACEACRGLKVKCEPDPGNPDGPCKRCAKAGRNCVVTQPTRKRQKKTDSRVAELEKKIDALTASLQATRNGDSTPEEQNGYGTISFANTPREWGAPPSARDAQPQYTPSADKSSVPPSQPPLAMAGQKRKFSDTRDIPGGVKESPAPQPSAAERRQPDIVDRGVVTMDEAARLFRRYTEHMAIHLPAVVFPRNFTVDDLRNTKPILFLAIMAVASSETPNFQRQLVKELMQIFAEKIIIIGEKSLEMVQSLLVSVIWYFPPEHFEELKFYQFIHLAAVMSIDIGLGRKKNNPKSRLIPYTWRDHPFRRHPLPDPTTVEARRTWLAAYFLASNVSMALHRPNLIRWQAFMTECMDILESSPDAAPTDRYLCHLVWTHRLAEEVGIQFSMDDPSVFVNITEQKVQYALRGFERDLTKYSNDIPKEEKQPSLLLSFHVLNLYMHEIALYVDKTNDEYRPPINADALRDPIPGLGDSLTAAHIAALSACLTAIDGIFETFLSMDIQSIRCLPIFNFVRVAYAVVVLIKMYFSASSPNSELGKVMDKDNMKVAEYLERLLDKFRETAANDRSRPAGKFLIVLMMLRGWFHKQGQNRGQGEDPADPNSKQVQPTPNGNGPGSSKADTAPSRQQPPHQAPAPPQHQPTQPQQQGFNPSNTPLQLLSEIATSNGPRNGQNAIPPTTNANSPAYQNWLQGGTQPSPFMYDPSAGVATTAGADPMAGMTRLGPGGILPPWMTGGSFSTDGSDLDYLSMGDGFEQAMGLTLTGFGGASPGDSASYENSMRMMMQNDPSLNGLFDNFPSSGNTFGF
ncbi:hypothetical protein F4780DRAFT_770419 [Xylariomycetidae sp. FL0641]|nr:hypothetical protein F4780DRAFT_770419 [Xylariomycetidae sp. FL0641]